MRSSQSTCSVTGSELSMPTRTVASPAVPAVMFRRNALVIAGRPSVRLASSIVCCRVLKLLLRSSPVICKQARSSTAQELARHTGRYSVWPQPALQCLRLHCSACGFLASSIMCQSQHTQTCRPHSTREVRSLSDRTHLKADQVLVRR